MLAVLFHFVKRFYPEMKLCSYLLHVMTVQPWPILDLIIGQELRLTITSILREFQLIKLVSGGRIKIQSAIGHRTLLAPTQTHLEIPS